MAGRLGIGVVTANTVIRPATLPWLMNRLSRRCVVVAVARGPGPDRGRVGARLGLGQREGDQLLPGGELGTQRAFCSSVPAEEERQRGELLDREDQPGRRARAADLLDRQADASAGRRRGRRIPRGTAAPGCRGPPGAGGCPRGTRRSCRSRRPAARPARRQGRGRRRGGAPAPRSADTWAAASGSLKACLRVCVPPTGARCGGAPRGAPVRHPVRRASQSSARSLRRMRPPTVMTATKTVKTMTNSATPNASRPCSTSSSHAGAAIAGAVTGCD